MNKYHLSARGLHLVVGERQHKLGKLRKEAKAVETKHEALCPNRDYSTTEMEVLCNT